ncbi:MAG: 50S ribosomal protein L35ae [Candidatus Micrarchaeota archaeon]|nr:50S ribosomal protein L35ae [Candidatus Micrarchaeota archaeon]
MDAIIENYRRGRHTEYCEQFIVNVEGVDSSEKAAKLVGKKVVWTTPSGKSIPGKIASTHGNSGKVRVMMEKGLPGQAVGTKLQVA